MNLIKVFPIGSVFLKYRTRNKFKSFKCNLILKKEL